MKSLLFCLCSLALLAGCTTPSLVLSRPIPPYTSQFVLVFTYRIPLHFRDYYDIRVRSYGVTSLPPEKDKALRDSLSTFRSVPKMLQFMSRQGYELSTMYGTGSTGASEAGSAMEYLFTKREGDRP